MKKLFFVPNEHFNEIFYEIHEGSKSINYSKGFLTFDQENKNFMKCLFYV